MVNESLDFTKQILLIPSCAALRAKKYFTLIAIEIMDLVPLASKVQASDPIRPEEPGDKNGFQGWDAVYARRKADFATTKIKLVRQLR